MCNYTGILYDPASHLEKREVVQGAICRRQSPLLNLCLPTPNQGIELHRVIPQQETETYAMMDHEKPQAVSPQVFEYGEQHNSFVMSDLSPDNSETLYGPTPSITEADNLENRRERRGENLWFVFRESQPSYTCLRLTGES